MPLPKVFIIISKPKIAYSLTDQNTFSSLTDIRKELNKIDNELLNLLAKRINLALKAVPFKQSEDAVYDQDREEEILSMVKKNALEMGINVEMTKEVFETILKWSRAEVQKNFRKNAENRKQ